MSQAKQRQLNGATNLSQILASEARLNRLHRLFKTHFNVTEPSIILEPYLFLGNCISAYDINHLSTLGIRYILNVAIRDVELCPYYSNDTRTLTIDLRDDDRENILRIFDQAFAFIDEAKRNKSRILVHCSHGQSRSPAIVLGYLMRTYNVSLEQCLIHVVKARPCVLPNDGFLKQLILYDRFLVERRRQRQQQQQTSDSKVVNDITKKEIPISVDPPKSTTPIVLAPPQYSANETKTLTNTQRANSVDSIHVIPIQISPKISHSEKIEKIPVEEAKTNTTRSKENNPVVARGSRSNRSLSSKKRQNTLTTAAVVKSTPSETFRSHSAHNQVNHSSLQSSTRQGNITIYYPQEYHIPKEKKPTKYITEIYDKATNRFIPANC